MMTFLNTGKDHFRDLFFALCNINVISVRPILPEDLGFNDNERKHITRETPVTRTISELSAVIYLIRKLKFWSFLAF